MVAYFEFHPPLSEQQRIVGILDEAFDGIATAKANAEKNLQNTRAIFESHLQSVFTQRGKGWVKKSLGRWTSTGRRNGLAEHRKLVSRSQESCSAVGSIAAPPR